MHGLEGKSVIVTGSSSGIGEATAILFASKGANIVLSGRSAERLKETSDKCKKTAIDAGHGTSKFITAEGDITAPSVRGQVVAQTVEVFGGIDVLVVNHGETKPKDVLETMTEERFDELIDVNLKSMLFLIQSAMPELEKLKGSIVCVSTIASDQVLPGLLVYSLAKAAVDHLVRSLALDLGPKGIRVNAVKPTYVPTRFLRHWEAESEGTSEWTDPLLEPVAKHTPLESRSCSTDDQARVIVFLASQDAGFVSGECVRVDGALHCKTMPPSYEKQ